MSRLFVTAMFLVSFVAPAMACPSREHSEGVCPLCGCVPDIIPSGPGTIPPVLGLQGLAQQASNDGNQALAEAASNVGDLLKRSPEETRKAVDQALDTGTQAISDNARDTVQDANDIVDAVKAVERFGEREINGQRDALSSARRRERQGKVADAIWHIGTDDAKNTNKDAALATQESKLIDEVAQAAASYYGGAAGAAAYAAWKTYNEKKDVGLAIKAGVYAYVLKSYGSSEAITNGSVDDIAKQAATTGAIAGLAVAARGGSTKESLDAFVQAGGQVVVQSGEAYVDTEYVDPAIEQADAYCTSSLDTGCADASEWIDRAKEYAQATRSGTAPTVTVTADGQWAISWNASAVDAPQANVPGVALTYIGQGSPFYDRIKDLVDLGNGIEPLPDVLPSQGWVFLGRYFDDGSWDRPRASEIVGEAPEALTNRSITLNSGVNLRQAAYLVAKVTATQCLTKETPIVGGLAAGTVVKILKVVRLPGCRSYIWAQVQQ